MKTPLPQNASPIEIATLAHAGQFRRDGVTPYIEHPKAVASMFEEWSLEWQVAWAHDIVEDTEYTLDDLRDAGMNESVVFVLNLLTKTKGKPYLEYINELLPYKAAVKVKLADMVVNLSDDPSDRQKEKYQQATPLLLAAL